MDPNLRARRPPLSTEGRGGRAFDTLSHAAWGWILLRRHGRREAWLGALAGAAPDVLYFVPARIEGFLERGWEGVFVGGEPGIWRAGGPPMPEPLVEAYHRYYVWTHSLVVLAAACALLVLAGRRRWLRYALPYGVAVAMDVPTHERYLTPVLHPLSDWTFRGIAWSDPVVWWPHAAALAAALAFALWRHEIRPRARPERGTARPEP